MIKTIGVIGAGQMGSGISQVCAAKYQTFLWDLNSQACSDAHVRIFSRLEKAHQKSKITKEQLDRSKNHLKLAKNLEEAISGADLVIEAIVEKMELKVQLFSKVRQINPDCIIASNTSSISISKMGNLAKLGSRFIGLHFMNPVPIMKLVEAVIGLQTDVDTLERAKSFVESLDKVWVQGKDYPGFVVNRILMPMINEGAYALMEGLAQAKDIDTAMKLGCNFPMGPLELADFIGLDTCVSIMNILHQGHGHPKFAPCPLLVQYVDAGYLGRKSGKGFFSYS